MSSSGAKGLLVLFFVMHCVFLIPPCRRSNSSKDDLSTKKSFKARVTLGHFNGISEWLVVNLALSVTGELIGVWSPELFPYRCAVLCC